MFYYLRKHGSECSYSQVALIAWGWLSQAHCKEEKAIVYFLTCACVDLHAAVLGRLPGLQGIHVKALHGRMKQAAREATLATFAALPSGDHLVPSNF